MFFRFYNTLINRKNRTSIYFKLIILQPVILTKLENIKCISNSPDDSLIVFGDDEKWLHFMDLSRPDIIEHIEGSHGDEITCIEWHPTKSLIMTTSKDCSIKLWCPR